MAKIEAGTVPFRGRVGAMVGYSWRGIACVRSYRSRISYPNTERQRAQKDWFVAMVRMAGAVAPALRLGMRQTSLSEHMTEGNLFVRRNKQHFRRSADGVEVDYKRLVFSDGPVTNVGFRSADFDANERVCVEFDKRASLSLASGDDSVYLLAYCPALGEAFLSEAAARRQKRIATTLPEAWSGLEVHLYGFTVDREGRASNTAYIGLGRVNHYEERGVYIPINKSWDDFVDLAHRENGFSAAHGGENSKVDCRKEAAVDAGEPPEVP